MGSQEWKRRLSAFASFLHKKREWLTARIRAMTFKQVILSLLAVLLLLTPTFGAWIYTAYKNMPDQSQSLSVELYHKNGDVIFSETGDPTKAAPSSLLGMFFDILTSSEPIASPPRDPASAPFLRAKVILNGASTEIRCYFSFENESSFYTTVDGSAHSIPSGVNGRFLASSYAQSFYESATPPSLLTIESNTILPKYSSWYYQNSRKEFVESTTQALSEQTLTYDITGELGIHFTKEPDSCDVSVYEGDQKIYGGTLADLSQLTVSSGSTLRITIRANWFQSEERDYYGNLGYEFEVQIRNPAVFSVDRLQVDSGKFVILSCQNVSDPQKIQFTSHQKMASPVFRPDGDLYRAILPIPEDFSENALSFRLTYGATSQEFSLTVTRSAEKHQFFYSDWALPVTETMRSRYESEWSSLLSATRFEGETPLYFRGNFLDPRELGYTLSYVHGSEIFYGEGLTDSFFAVGSEFVANNGCGNDIPVFHHGRVISIGRSEFFGLFAVVDHGGGLRTWYGHLSDLSVEVGDVLQKGESVGKTGTSGLASAEGFLVICTVYDTVIHPETILGRSFDPS